MLLPVDVSPIASSITRCRKPRRLLFIMLFAVAWWAVVQMRVAQSRAGRPALCDTNFGYTPLVRIEERRDRWRSSEWNGSAGDGESFSDDDFGIGGEGSPE